MAELSDPTLLAQVTSGSIEAFETLVRRYEVRVFRLSVNMLGNELDAAEVTQDVFFSVWRSATRFRGDSTFSTWLYRVTANHCLKALRKRRSSPANATLAPPRSSHGEPEAEYEARETRTRIGLAVGALSDDQRAPLLLREVEGLSYADIAEILGLSVAAVKSRLRRARVELAKALEEAP